MEGKKIMICDDDHGILEVLEMMLEIEGFTVFRESNSTNLLSEIKRTSPDLLLMDLWMPVLSGDQILKVIRTSEEFKNLPVIILSASVDGKEIANNAGANGFIPKPFNMDEMIVDINNMLAGVPNN
ncbi:response regulator [Chryseobacterium sp. FH1]|uniref:response regulator n=1 Tax=Chryseobacterium sp. FH1 TaxID=1233951 RepID=UPI0004E42908|nr:response regulator [Chryseobacterium sp. FH1]KFC20548.1 histidine kinase [Chryseobacterium sp. FH1]